MQQQKLSDGVAREGILKLLSDRDLAGLASEPCVRLEDGDEYLDLDHLSQGVLCGCETPTAVGQVLPRRAIQVNTWAAILGQLATVSAPCRAPQPGDDAPLAKDPGLRTLPFGY
jgi:hypothetical protein